MKKFKLFLELIRINKPTGTLLLFWPCIWGLTLVNDFNINKLIYLKYAIFFFFRVYAYEICGLYSK